MKIAIIGTAGRGEIPTPEIWTWAQDGVYSLLEQIKAKTGSVELGSGGAAWADALAPRIFRIAPHLVSSLDLFLPAEWLPFHYKFESTPAGKIANHYHQLAAEHIPDGLTDLDSVIDGGAVIHYPDFKNTIGDFHLRNTLLANWAEVVIAITFGNGQGVRDGGTHDTVKKFLSRGIRPHITHFDLSTQEVYLANPKRI